MALRPILLLGATFLLVGGEVGAQPSSLRPLEPGHWSYELLEVLHALGRAPAWQPWQAPALAGTVSEVLEEVGEGGPGDGVVERWRGLFDGEAGIDAGPHLPLLVEVKGGFEASEALPWDERRAFGSVRGELWATEGVTLWAEGTASESDGLDLRSGGLAFRARGFQVLAGRLRLGMGQGLNRLLLNGIHDFDGLWVGSARPVALPGLRFLGKVSAHLFVGPGLENPPSDSVPGGTESWFLTTGVQIEPHERVRIGVMRTARFAGDSVEEATFGRVLKAVTVGGGGSDFDDGQGEVAVRVRLDPFGLGLTPYVSLGFEDRRALWEDPALVAGVLVPRTVEGDLVSFRYEYTGFGKRGFWCRACDWVFHQWYRHRVYGPYVLGGRPLGTLLGGYGSSHQMELQYWSGGAPVRARAFLFREKREAVPEKGERGRNLLLDRWPGVRKGMGFEAAIRPTSNWEVGVEGLVTSTENGNESGIALYLRILDLFRLSGA